MSKSGVTIASQTRGKWARTPLSTHMDAYVYTFRPTNWQTDRQSFSKSREWVFLHLFMFIGIRFEWSALKALFVQTCLLHTVRLKHNIRGLYNKIWYQNHKLLVTVFSDLCQNERRNSLCSFARARTAQSTYSLCSAPLWYTHFAMLACLLRLQDRSFTSLTPSWSSWNSWMCSCCKNAVKKVNNYGKEKKRTLCFASFCLTMDLNHRKSMTILKLCKKSSKCDVAGHCSFIRLKMAQVWRKKSLTGKSAHFNFFPTSNLSLSIFVNDEA